MIKQIKVSNYKSLGQNTVINFENMTVFVGQNGSGKSNIVDIFKFLSDIMSLGLEGAITKRHGIKAIRRWSSGKPLSVIIEIKIEDIKFYGTYKFEISSHSKHDYIVKYEKAIIQYKDSTKTIYEYEINNQRWTQGLSDLMPKIDPLNLALPLISGDERIRDLGNALRNIQIYSIYPDQLRSPQLYDPNKPMEFRGNNWVSILKDLDTNIWKNELVSALHKLTGEIDDIEIKQISGYLLAKFRHGVSGKSKKAKWFDTSQESDGTLRIAGIISALLQEPNLMAIGVEEPELTIHPGAIDLLFDFFKQANKRSQVLLTTHSPELLDKIDPYQVRIVEKINEITHVNVLTEEDKVIVQNKLMSLGEIHRTKGLNVQLSIFEQEI